MSSPRPTHLHFNHDLFKPRLDSFIDMNHELVLLSDRIDWKALDAKAAEKFPASRGRKALPTRFTLGLLILKSIDNLSDEKLIRLWVQNPYYRYFTGEEFFQHKCPHQRANLSHIRSRRGEDLEGLLTESLCVAIDSGALDPSTLNEVSVDTTVMEKNITYPTDAKLMVRAITAIAELCKDKEIKQRQTYEKVIKTAHVRVNRYAHAR